MTDYSKTNKQLEVDATTLAVTVGGKISASAITVVDSSMYWTKDGSTTTYSWTIAVV